MGEVVKVKDVARGQTITMDGIPCIKTSENIVELNDNVPSVTCYVQKDREVFVAEETPENDPFFYEDTEKRIGGECLVELRP